MPSLIGAEDSLQTKVVKQLEYYFSDINLRNDKFLQNMTQKDSGWLSIETLMKFNRLKSLVNNEKSLLIEALKTLHSDLIECHPNEGKVRRRADRPVPKLDDLLKRSLGDRSFAERTVVVKGFPKDLTSDELMQWSQQFGSVLNTKMKKSKPSHKWKGCAVITFSDKAMADRLVNQLVLKFKDKELTKETKWAQNQRKRKLLDSKKETDLLVNKMRNISVDTTAEQKKAILELEGTVLQLIGLPRRLVTKEKKKKSNRIKEFFSGYGKVVYVSSDSSANCLIQFIDRSVAQKVLDLNKTLTDDKQVVHKLVFNGKEVMARLLSVNEEMAFWVRAHKRTRKKIELKQKKAVKESVEMLGKRPNLLASGQEPKRLTPASA